MQRNCLSNGFEFRSGLMRSRIEFLFIWHFAFFFTLNCTSMTLKLNSFSLLSTIVLYSISKFSFQSCTKTGNRRFQLLTAIAPSAVSFMLRTLKKLHFTVALDALLLGQLFIFWTIFQPWAISSDVQIGRAHV